MRSPERLGRISPLLRNGTNMATTAALTSTTREKLERAKAASARLAQLSTDEKNALLLKMADAIQSSEAKILAANNEDIERSNLQGAMRDRLLLTPVRVNEMANAGREVPALPDPVGEVIEEGPPPTALHIPKVRVPLCPVAILY